jgi:hypothetical protein
MAVTVSGTSITFNDSTVQTTAAVAPTTAQVLSATAGASVGAVGTYAFLGRLLSANTVYATPGTTKPGSELQYSTSSAQLSGSSPAGTWRCMGYMVGPGVDFERATVWLRIS